MKIKYSLKKKAKNLEKIYEKENENPHEIIKQFLLKKFYIF